MGQANDNDSGKREHTPKARGRGVNRRTALKIGTLAGVGLPLVITLLPTEARAQGTGGS